MKVRNRLYQGVGVATALLFASQAIAGTAPTGDVLTDSGFESGTNPLQAFARACGDPWIPGEWNAEAATLIVGSISGVSPHTGDGMLRVNSTGGAGSQVTQVIDVNAFDADIDSGDAIAIFSAWINPSAAGVNGTLVLQAGISQTCVGTLNPEGGTFIQGFNQVNTSLVGDGDLGTWELVTCSLRLPIGTRFLVLQLSGNNAEIPANGLFFDTAAVAICVSAEPASCASDLNGDGFVGAGDLAFLLGSWGPCP